LISTGTDANVQVRGVSPKCSADSHFRESIPGAHVPAGPIGARRREKRFQNLFRADRRQYHQFGGGHWQVVGVFDAGGSAFDSEIWCDAKILNQVLLRPPNIFQSATVHLDSPASFQAFKDSVTSNPQLNVDAIREVDYYAKQSTTMTRLITVLGGLVALIMAVGAVFGALNTMYSAVAERGREIATMRAVASAPGASSSLFSSRHS